MTRRYVHLVALALVAMLVAACTSGSSPADQPDPLPEPAPAEPAEPEEPPTDEPGEPEPDPHANEIALFFARSTEDRIWVEPEYVWIEGAEDEAAFDAMVALFSTQPNDPELFSAVPRVDVQEVTVTDGVLDVSVASDILGTSGGSAQEVAFVNQLTHTAAALDGVDQVRLLVDGEAVSDMWGHLDWSNPFAADPFVLTPIVIDTPAYGTQTGTGSYTISGEATVFEATFALRIVDGDGATVEDVVITASAGGPERGTWEHTTTFATPGEYTIIAEEIDPSGGEGRPPLLIERTIVVA